MVAEQLYSKIINAYNDTLGKLDVRTDPWHGTNTFVIQIVIHNMRHLNQLSFVLYSIPSL